MTQRQTPVEWFLLEVRGAKERVQEILGLTPNPGGEGTPVPDASTTVKGIVELATVAEAEAGTDTARAVTPEGVAAAIAATSGQTEIRAIVTTGTPSITVDRNTTGANLSVSFPGGGQIVYMTADQPIFTAKTYAYGGGSFYGASNRRVEVVKLSTTVIRLNIVNATTGDLTSGDFTVPVLVDILP
jgi:hypothetical protein